MLAYLHPEVRDLLDGSDHSINYLTTELQIYTFCRTYIYCLDHATQTCRFSDKEIAYTTFPAPPIALTLDHETRELIVLLADDREVDSEHVPRSEMEVIVLPYYYPMKSFQEGRQISY